MKYLLKHEIENCYYQDDINIYIDIEEQQNKSGMKCAITLSIDSYDDYKKITTLVIYKSEYEAWYEKFIGMIYEINPIVSVIDMSREYA